MPSELQSGVRFKFVLCFSTGSCSTPETNKECVCDMRLPPLPQDDVCVSIGVLLCVHACVNVYAYKSMYIHVGIKA